MARKAPPSPAVTLKTAASVPESVASVRAYEEKPDLLFRLPPGANIIFGGNYGRLLAFVEAHLKPLVDGLGAAAGQGPDLGDSVRSYVECFGAYANNVEFAGSVEVRDGAFKMRLIFGGVTLDVLERCANKLEFAFRKDDDGKYFELQDLPDGSGGKASAGYYFSEAEVVHFLVATESSLRGTTLKPASRDELEADVAQAATPEQAQRMKVMLEAVDRRSGFWMAGLAEGTPLASSVVGGQAWIDADRNSMTFEASVEFRDSAQAEMLAVRFRQLETQLVTLDRMGPSGAKLKEAAKSFFELARVENSQGTLKGHFVVTAGMLKNVVPFVDMLVARRAQDAAGQ